MKKITLLLFLFIASSCVNVAKKENSPHQFVAVKVDDIFKGDLSIRALTVDNDHIFFAGSKGKFGYLNTADHSISYVGRIQEDSIVPEFRSLARVNKKDFILSAGKPALLYKVNYFGKRKLMYEESCDGVFYDSMAFWNEQEGLAIGDPTANCMSIIITRNGGESWEKLSCDDLPKTVEGEAAFAASNTNIAVVGNKAWVISGGEKSRVYFTPDKGITWTVYDTPLVQGKESTGGYSIDFYDEKNGVIIGGDYTKPEKNVGNKAITKDGGKTWKLIANGENPGYKSCIKFVPNSGGKELIAVGFTGISYSNDFGETWVKLSDDSFYTLRFMNEFTAYAAGNGKISRLTFMENDLKN